ARSSIERSSVNSRSATLSSAATRIAWDTANPNPSRITLSDAVSMAGLRDVRRRWRTGHEGPAAAPLSHEAQPPCPTSQTGGFQAPAARRRPAPRLVVPALLAAGLHLLHIGVDRVEDFVVRVGLAIDDDLVD